VLVDDVDNQAFGEFVREADVAESMVMRSADGPWTFEVMREHGGSRYQQVMPYALRA